MTIFLFLIVLTSACEKECCGSPIHTLYQNFNDLLLNGDTEVYLPGYAWHNRLAYEKNRIKKYNENAWGGGLGKAKFDKYQNQHSLYAFAFLDSHADIEPIAGYAFQKTFSITDHSYFGLGFTVFLTSRSDLFNFFPFPGALPWLSLSLDRFTFIGTYVPGAKGAGNVLFMLIKWRI